MKAECPKCGTKAVNVKQVQKLFGTREMGCGPRPQSWCRECRRAERNAVNATKRKETESNPWETAPLPVEAPVVEKPKRKSPYVTALSKSSQRKVDMNPPLDIPTDREELTAIYERQYTNDKAKRSVNFMTKKLVALYARTK